MATVEGFKSLRFERYPFIAVSFPQTNKMFAITVVFAMLFVTDTVINCCFSYNVLYFLSRLQAFLSSPSSSRSYESAVPCLTQVGCWDQPEQTLATGCAKVYLPLKQSLILCSSTVYRFSTQLRCSPC